MPSLAISTVSPTLNDECMMLFSVPGAHCPSGASLNRITISTLAPIAFL